MTADQSKSNPSPTADKSEQGHNKSLGNKDPQDKGVHKPAVEQPHKPIESEKSSNTGMKKP